MKYEQIIFDIDGTLIDTDYAILHSLQDTIKYLTGNTVPFDNLSFALGITGDNALKKLNVGDIPFALKLWDKNMEKYSDSVKVFNDIPDLLSLLMKSGYKMGIVTSKTRKELEQDFSKFGLNQYFGTVICADDTKEHKPFSAPLLKYAEISGGSRKRMLYIGDSEYDRECAKGAGIDFALASWGNHVTEIQVECVLKNPIDLLSFIV